MRKIALKVYFPGFAYHIAGNPDISDKKSIL